MIMCPISILVQFVTQLGLWNYSPTSIPCGFPKKGLSYQQFQVVFITYVYIAMYLPTVVFSQQVGILQSYTFIAEEYEK